MNIYSLIFFLEAKRNMESGVKTEVIQMEKNSIISLTGILEKALQ